MSCALFHSSNLGVYLSPAALVSLMTEDRLDRSGREATRLRKESELWSGVPSGSQQPCAGSTLKL